MSVWDRIKEVLGREAADVGEGLRKVGRTLDEELARKERELDATPAERLEMVLEDIEADGDRLDEIETTLGTSGTRPGPPQRPAPTHQLFTRAEMASGDSFDEVVAAVDVTFETMAETDHTHVVRINQGSLSSDGLDLEVIATGLADHTLVEEARSSSSGALLIRAPNLHVEDVRLLTARAITQQLH